MTKSRTKEYCSMSSICFPSTATMTSDTLIPARQQIVGIRKQNAALGRSGKVGYHEIVGSRRKQIGRLRHMGF
jgi:hypothetical protein